MQITVEPDDTPEIVLLLVILVVFITFFGWMSYLLIISGFQSTNPDDPVRTDNRPKISIQCAQGQCATNLQSGFKTCPIAGETITVDPSQSVCNSPFVCDNPLTPFAVQSDGSTNINGVCEPNIQCACVNTSRCPDYILSVFTTSNGNPYQSLAGQRITFPQQSSFVGSNGQTDTPPIEIANPSTTFCAASLSFLPLSNPGCNFFSTADGNSMTYKDLLLCTNTGCSGFFNNPCLQGTLAVLSSNPDGLNQQNVLTSQFACVRGESCPCDYMTIYDTNYGGVICRKLPKV